VKQTFHLLRQRAAPGQMSAFEFHTSQTRIAATERISSSVRTEARQIARAVFGSGIFTGSGVVSPPGGTGIEKRRV
jgi:hypothetical protein